jgi:hypothetical protein
LKIMHDFSWFFTLCDRYLPIVHVFFLCK